MNPALEDLARLYVLDRLDADTRAAFAARLPSDSSLATLVDQLEAALDLRRGLLALSSPLNPAMS